MDGRKRELMQDACRQSMAKDKLLDFMKYNWLRPHRPLIVGIHTQEICAELDKAIELYKQGISSYLDIVVPFRHGKSDISSRYLPAYFLGHFPGDEVIQGSYGASLSEGFSKDVEKIMNAEQYKHIFDTRLNNKSNSTSERHIMDNTGKYFAVGADGGATGKGANLLIVDDFFKNRKEADSEQTRKVRWESFTQDFFSRLAPVHICLVLNTRWHVSDISGNIHKRNNKSHRDYDPEFPVFKKLHYKARYPDGSYLFTERFNESWYRKQFAMLGSYGAAALLQGEPTLRGGNMLKTDRIQIIERNELPKDLRFVRFWDLASTEKEVANEDPDFSSGALVATKVIDGLEHVYIKDMRWVQAEAPARNRLIEKTAHEDGRRVEVGIESVAGYKDTYTTMKKILKGKCMVKKVTVSKDKVIRASDLEPILEAGNVHMVRAWWNDEVIEQLSQFPNGEHDDHVDSIVGGYNQSKDLGMRAILA